MLTLVNSHRSVLMMYKVGHATINNNHFCKKVIKDVLFTNKLKLTLLLSNKLIEYRCKTKSKTNVFLSLNNKFNCN